jgi:protease-4
MSREAFPPPKGGPKKTSSLIWPLVILVIALFTVVSCSYNVSTMVSGLSFSGSPSLSSLQSPGVAVLVIEGEIFDTDWAISSLKRFAEDDKIKALVLRINSPGGAVAPCQELYRALKDFEKPIAVSMASVAASGGLYLAVAGDHIMANPGTLTGSIGVIMETIEFDQAMDKLGIKAQVIKSGNFKDIGSPFRSMRPEEEALLQSMVLEIYEQFVADVAAGRPKLDIQAVRALADGRVFTGQEALKQGLIDEYGGLKEAVDWAATEGGIEDISKVEVIYEDGRATLFEQLIGARLGLLDQLEASLRSESGFKFIYRPGLF